ncbi:hypothetical protein DPMN_012542 [Dreissena polymorpha]|uniref:Uncharacterized protein n=1 Tax=Dreissena polymorpha TaxID=45954 RepID=A0A9D4N613_DREPO|nr:hypothetical protein DPMN_012542 [Dreissena polymorpha]
MFEVTVNQVNTIPAVFYVYEDSVERRVSRGPNVLAVFAEPPAEVSHPISIVITV